MTPKVWVPFFLPFHFKAEVVFYRYIIFFPFFSIFTFWFWITGQNYQFIVLCYVIRYFSSTISSCKTCNFQLGQSCLHTVNTELFQGYLLMLSKTIFIFCLKGGCVIYNENIRSLFFVNAELASAITNTVLPTLHFGNWELESTVWKFHDYYIIQILREINFKDSWSAEFIILTHLEALNLHFDEFLHFLKA